MAQGGDVQTSELSHPIRDLESAWTVPEILAPAGGRAQFFAALQAGADAVFLGLKNFNARGRAENFSLEDLRELVPVARAAGMKVLVTLNILLKEEELPEVIAELSHIQALGIEALIVQDLGLARLIRRQFPKLRLHASTQLAVHNKLGVLAAAELGFKRVVLARELTAQELRRIRKEIPRETIEIEAFCHGSLCYSYSGLCFFSGAEDARSGNRGECAYTCRKPYQILNEPGHGFLFSMKDLDTSLDLEKLVYAGVDTLKIEGRKKDAQYVASTVGLYRQELNRIFGRETGRQTPRESRNYRHDMAFSFHRDTTSFFVKGRYHENVIDLGNPSHRGIAIGAIQALHGRKAELTTREALERFDGLRIEGANHTYHAKPQHGTELKSSIQNSQQKYGQDKQQFSLRDFYVSGQRVSSCPAGSQVTIDIPMECPLPQLGDQIFKIRSNELKRFTEALAQAPEGTRLRPLWLVDLKLRLVEEGNHLKLCALSYLGQDLIAEWMIDLPAERPKKPAKLAEDLAEMFRIFGDIEVEALTTIEGDLEWFIPKGILKSFKQKLSTLIREGLALEFARSQASAIESCLGERGRWTPRQETVSYQIKIDRLEYLSFLDRYLDAHPDFSCDEIIFEPKRAFLHGHAAGEFYQELFAFSSRRAIRLRFAIPTVIRAWDEPMLKKWVREFIELGGQAFELGNVGAWTFIVGLGLEIETLDLASDFTLYGLNTEAIAALRDMGIQRYALSLEDDRNGLMDKLEAWPLAAGSPQVILYKDTPLFIAEACSLTALHHGCPGSEVCGYRTLEIQNDSGERFYVAHESCKSIVYAADAFSWSQHKADFLERGIRDFRIDFLTRHYSEDEISRILKGLDEGQALPHTQNANYSRVLL